MSNEFISPTTGEPAPKLVFKFAAGFGNDGDPFSKEQYTGGSKPLMDRRLFCVAGVALDMSMAPIVGKGDKVLAPYTEIVLSLGESTVRKDDEDAPFILVGNEKVKWGDLIKRHAPGSIEALWRGRWKQEGEEEKVLVRQHPLRRDASQDDLNRAQYKLDVYYVDAGNRPPTKHRQGGARTEGDKRQLFTVHLHDLVQAINSIRAANTDVDMVQGVAWQSLGHAAFGMNFQPSTAPGVLRPKAIGVVCCRTDGSRRENRDSRTVRVFRSDNAAGILVMSVDLARQIVSQMILEGINLDGIRGVSAEQRQALNGLGLDDQLPSGCKGLTNALALLPPRLHARLQQEPTGFDERLAREWTREREQREKADRTAAEAAAQTTTPPATDNGGTGGAGT